jgi:hypothetical protein
MSTSGAVATSPGERAIYLYCCALPERLPAVLEVSGLAEGTGVRMWRHRDLASVTSDVPLEQFAGANAPADLQDLAWLAPRALQHAGVIEEVARFSPVFPARFGTLFLTRESLEGLLASHEDTIREFLARTDGTEEWGIKGFLDRNRAEERLFDEDLAKRKTRLSDSPGTRYMQERRLRGEAQAKLTRWLHETGARMKEELSLYAIESTERRLLPSAPGENGELVLSWAFLVPKPAVDAFRTASARLDRELGGWGLRFDSAGPFPPFSFTPSLGETRHG